MGGVVGVDRVGGTVKDEVRVDVGDADAGEQGVEGGWGGAVQRDGEEMQLHGALFVVGGRTGWRMCGEKGGGEPRRLRRFARVERGPFDGARRLGVKSRRNALCGAGLRGRAPGL